MLFYVPIRGCETTDSRYGPDHGYRVEEVCIPGMQISSLRFGEEIAFQDELSGNQWLYAGQAREECLQIHHCRRTRFLSGATQSRRSARRHGIISRRNSCKSGVDPVHPNYANDLNVLVFNVLAGDKWPKSNKRMALLIYLYAILFYRCF